MTAGLGTVTVIAVCAYLQPGILDSGHSDIPNAAGRLTYPIGYWNGAAALFAIAAVLLVNAAAEATSRVLRTAATAAIPLTPAPAGPELPCSWACWCSSLLRGSAPAC